MKTERAPLVTSDDEGSVFDQLLSRQSRLPSSDSANMRVDGIAVGVLEQIGDGSSHTLVSIPSLGLRDLKAVSMVALAPADIGRSVALGFEGANAHRPILLGLMLQADGVCAADSENVAALPNTLQVSGDGKRVVIEAGTELELRCGEAVILLSHDGSIQIRGAYVTTHASASNRIRGASVQIN